MLLAYLKDTQHKFRHLKIILLQTTIQYDTLVKYFGNVATYTSRTWATRGFTFDRYSCAYSWYERCDGRGDGRDLSRSSADRHSRLRSGEMSVCWWALPKDLAQLSDVGCSSELWSAALDSLVPAGWTILHPSSCHSNHYLWPVPGYLPTAGTAQWSSLRSVLFSWFVRPQEQTMSEEDRYFSDLIGRCFCFGLIEDLQLMVDFIVKQPEKRKARIPSFYHQRNFFQRWISPIDRVNVFSLGNYQHPLTLVTPLMCLAMWSIQDSLKRLLAIENVSINLRAVNNFSALDFARKYATSETLDLLERSLTWVLRENKRDTVSACNMIYLSTYHSTVNIAGKR